MQRGGCTAFLPFCRLAMSLHLLALSSATSSSSMPARIEPGSFSRVLPSLVEAAFSLESSAYPADEAATLENLQLRSEVAGDYFWCVRADAALEGFVCGTLTCGDTLTEESMSVHEPEGTTLCIHSVVVAEERRRLGLGTAMLKAREACACTLHLRCMHTTARASRSKRLSCTPNAGLCQAGCRPHARAHHLAHVQEAADPILQRRRLHAGGPERCGARA